MHEWQELTKLAGGQAMIVERVRLDESGIRLEGEFVLPPLARMTAEDQLFVAAFVRSHGSIKRMEALFGVSYPTVKNRLNRIGEQLEFVDVQIEPPGDREEILARVERGEMTIEEALIQLEKGESDEQ